MLAYILGITELGNKAITNRDRLQTGITNRDYKSMEEGL